jgi:hypothetical protein
MFPSKLSEALNFYLLSLKSFDVANDQVLNVEVLHVKW